MQKAILSLIPRALAQAHTHRPPHRARLQEGAGVSARPVGFPVRQGAPEHKPHTRLLPPSLLPPGPPGGWRASSAEPPPFPLLSSCGHLNESTVASQSLLGLESFPGFQTRALSVLLLIPPPRGGRFAFLTGNESRIGGCIPETLLGVQRLLSHPSTVTRHLVFPVSGVCLPSVL